jgi:hypothetical protein
MKMTKDHLVMVEYFNFFKLTGNFSSVWLQADEELSITAVKFRSNEVRLLVFNINN